MSHEKALEWPERLTLRDTKVIADEGQRIFTTATGYGYEKREYIRADLAHLSAIVPDDVAGLVERLRLRAKTLNTGAFVSPDDISTMGYYSRGSAKLDTDAASTITALAARAEKAAEAEAWERRAGEAIMGEAAAVERITTLEAENAALRARLEEATGIINAHWQGRYWSAMDHIQSNRVNAFLGRFLEEEN